MGKFYQCFGCVSAGSRREKNSFKEITCKNKTVTHKLKESFDGIFYSMDYRRTKFSMPKNLR